MAASNPYDFIEAMITQNNNSGQPFEMFSWCSNISLDTVLPPNTGGRSISGSSSPTREHSFYVQQRIIIDVYVVSALCLVGFVGNALTIAVLRRDRLTDGSSTATNWLLRSLAAVDTVYLVSCLFIQTTKTAHDFTDQFPDGLRPYFPYVEQFLWPMASIAHTITVWTVLLVTVDRYIAVCRPFNTTLRTSVRVKATFSALCLVAIIYNVPQFFERQVVERKKHSCTDEVIRSIDTTQLRDNDIYYVVYKTAGNLVFRTVGPLVALLVLNAFLIRALHAARQRHQKLSSSSSAAAAAAAAAGAAAKTSKQTTAGGGSRRRNSSRNRENITLMLVAVVSVFIVCQLPDLGLRIGVAIIGRSGHTSAARTQAIAAPGMTDSTGGGLPPSVDRSAASSEDFIRYVNSITNVLMALNSAVNFLIYCLVGKKFRRIFVDMFVGDPNGCCGRRWLLACRRSRGGQTSTQKGFEVIELGQEATVASHVMTHHQQPRQGSDEQLVQKSSIVAAADCVAEPFVPTDDDGQVGDKTTNNTSKVLATDMVDDRDGQVIVTSSQSPVSGGVDAGCELSVEEIRDAPASVNIGEESGLDEEATQRLKP